MKSVVPLSFAAVFCLFCAVEWTAGVPVPNEGEHHSNSSSSEEDYWVSSEERDYSAGDKPSGDQPSGDKPFPFREYQNESKSYLVVDDMIINRDPSRAGLVNAAWPEGIVPYTFQYSIAPNQRTQILQAMSELSACSCIKFRPATKEDTYNVEYRNDPMSQGCSSFVGWQNRKNQPIQLSTVCSKGNAIHEILHALGFFHEQTRDDRDEYVTVHLENVQPGYENNFKKDGELYPDAETGYFEVPYNYDSIMHYGKTYFSKNNQNTIDVLNNPAAIGNGEHIGQRDYISEGDMKMLREKYNCPEPDESLTTEAPPAEETSKTTTGNPMCQYNPGLPVCKTTKKPDSY